MKRQVLYAIGAVLIMAVVIVGSTYAFFSSSIGGNRNITADSSDFSVIYTGGTEINGEMPVTTDKTNAFSTSVNIRMAENSVLAVGTLYITIESISENLRIPGFKWEVYKVVNNSEVLQSRGNFNGYNDTNNNVVTIVNNYQLSTTNTTFVIYLWVDGTLTNNNVLGGIFSGYIGAYTMPFTGEL